jgi:glycosyltransferase involved in cell wall biosynthesis
MKEASDKPLLSFLIFTYNQEEFVAEAVNAAFAQTYSPLEIIISDDCSTDGTLQIVEDLVKGYEGPHHVFINKNSRNEGVGEHVNILFGKAKGELFILAAGDDVSDPNRTAIIYDEWKSSGGVFKSIFSNVFIIDEFSNVKGQYFTTPPVYTRTLEEFKSISTPWIDTTPQPKCWALGCSQAIHRSLYDIYGRLDSKIVQEDGAISFRGILQGEIRYIDKCLMKYRRHSSSLFQPGNLSSILYLKKNELHYKNSWLTDALLTNSSDKQLIEGLKRECRAAYVWHLIYGIPVIGKVTLGFRFYLKRPLRFFLQRS